MMKPILVHGGAIDALRSVTRRHLSSMICGNGRAAASSTPSALSRATGRFDRCLSTTAVEELDEPIAEVGEWAGCKRSFMQPIKVSSRGANILVDPLFNKGTAFKSGERDRLRFRGLLPARIMNIQKQKERFLIALRSETSAIRKNLLLEDLHDRNETLYHRVLVDHMEEMAPIIYTPTVGQVCMEFAARFRRPRGMYFTVEDRGNMAAMVYNWPHNDVHVIVVTDGSRILGLGE
jgi:Malic enzyme, N-terminal domain